MGKWVTTGCRVKIGRPIHKTEEGGVKEQQQQQKIKVKYYTCTYNTRMHSVHRRLRILIVFVSPCTHLFQGLSGDEKDKTWTVSPRKEERKRVL